MKDCAECKLGLAHSDMGHYSRGMLKKVMLKMTNSSTLVLMGDWQSSSAVTSSVDGNSRH